MNLVLDYGNTRIKVGVFEQFKLKEAHSFTQEKECRYFLNTKKFDYAIVSSLTGSPEKILSRIAVKNKKIQMRYDIPLPVNICYDTPRTLGEDRIAAACGAVALMPSQQCLVVDLGTCINFEWIDEHANYFGGSISPGIQMRFQAMHTFTTKLPLVKAQYPVKLTASKTEECMQSGVMNGVLAEVQGIIDQYRKEYPDVNVILCGGDSFFLKKKVDSTVVFCPDLVLIGLNNILLHNVSL